MRALKLHFGTQPEYQAAEGHLITLFQKTQALHVLIHFNEPSALEQQSAADAKGSVRK